MNNNKKHYLQHNGEHFKSYIDELYDARAYECGYISEVYMEHDMKDIYSAYNDYKNNDIEF